MNPGIYIESTDGLNVQPITNMEKVSILKQCGIYFGDEYCKRAYVAGILIAAGSPVRIGKYDNKVYVLIDKYIPWIQELIANGIDDIEKLLDYSGGVCNDMIKFIESTNAYYHYYKRTWPFIGKYCGAMISNAEMTNTVEICSLPISSRIIFKLSQRGFSMLKLKNIIYELIDALINGNPVVVGKHQYNNTGGANEA